MPVSARLSYRRLTRGDLPTFLALARDPHVRRYLLDGEIVDEAWARAELERSDALFESRDVGLWLVSRDERTIGFAGFRVYEDMAHEPQLLYAFPESESGKGHATEAARALLGQTSRWPRVVSAVDRPNQASAGVLRKLGFAPYGTHPGAFGPIDLYELRR